MKKYPKSMATQHPDNSSKYVSIQEEPDEAIYALTPQVDQGLGIDEIMIDFEGKLTPYHQTSQIALSLIGNGLIPGKDVWVTPRIPNAKKEPVFRQLMSLMSLVETNILAYKTTQIQAIKETIVPMIETGEELIQIHERINSVIELGNKNYDIQFPYNSIRIIPLVESVPALVQIDEILDVYYKDSLQNNYAFDNIRVMFARSDSAMSYGMMASVLSVITAIRKSYHWGIDNGVEVAPILGCGALPFRGHLTKDTVDAMTKTYAGIKTFTIQSGIRYDHGDDATKSLVNQLNAASEAADIPQLTSNDLDFIYECIGIFTKNYSQTFVQILDTVDFIARYIPKNRDRLSSGRTGLEYVREVADLDRISKMVKGENLRAELLSIPTDIKCSVPRAISFTASMYTLGLPPEFLGTGRGLSEVLEKYGDEGIKKLLSFYPMLIDDLTVASKYVNCAIAKGILSEKARLEYLDDFQKACDILNITPMTSEEQDEEFYHALMKSTRPIILHLIGKQKDLFNNEDEEHKILHEWIIKMGKIRGSLG